MAMRVDEVPEHRRAQALVALERLERLTGDDDGTWAY
jgi:hypothetical protein